MGSLGVLYRFTAGLLLSVSLLFQEPKQEETIKLHALSAVLMDADSGRILYEKEGNTMRPMASTTKIMTCILALEYGEPDMICTASKTAAAQPKVHLGVKSGMEFYLNDLLYSLMLESHNDTAVMIAEAIGGSVEGFAERMNEKARALGCEHTYFITPNGLDAKHTLADGTEVVHSTTAEDLARIMRYCIMQSPKKEQFLEITRTSNYSFTDASGKHSFSCINHNALLTMVSGALSGKTGFTGGAGYSYVGAVEDEGRTFVLALLGSGWPPHKSYKWEDAKRLLRYGCESFHYQDVYEEPEPILIPIEDGIEDEFVKLETMVLPEDQHFWVLLKDGETVKKHIRIPAVLTAPVDRGEVVGEIWYELDETVLKVYPLRVNSSIRSINLAYCLRKIYNIFFLKFESV